MSISKKVIEHPVLTLCAFALIAIIAFFTLGNIQIDLMPDMDMPVVMVMTSYDNAGPESVEKSVTEVLESGLVSLSNLDEMTSESSEGSSLIKLQFNYGTDLEVAVNDIRDKLDQVKGSLPDDCDSPQIFKFSSDSRPIMTLSLSGNKTADELRKLADDSVADVLEQTSGISQASVSGGREAIVRVRLRTRWCGRHSHADRRGLSSEGFRQVLLLWIRVFRPSGRQCAQCVHQPCEVCQELAGRP